MAAHSTPASKWMAYLSDNVILDDVEAAAPGMFWPQQNLDPAQHNLEQGDCSGDVAGVSPEETDDSHRGLPDSRKRQREEVGRDYAQNKANREKMRRDRLNDRFIDLSKALEPGKPPKMDKATILCDAVRVLGQLRQEAVTLKDTNAQLREQIRELKAEKSELRDEKARLKAEKERLEQQVKAMTFPAGFMPHAAAMQAAAAAFAAQAQAAHSATAPLPKLAPTPVTPPVAMWQWLPPASVDTSQDHMLRPPVA